MASIGDFISSYWLQLVTVVVTIVAIFFYSAMPEHEKRSWKKWIFLFIIIIAWIELTPIFNSNYTSIRVTDIFFYTLVALFFIFFFFVYQEKYKTMGQVIADGCHGSFFPAPRVIGPFTAFNVGSSCNTFPIYEGDFTLVVPTIFIDWMGPKAFCDVQVTKRDLYKLPLPVANFLLSEADKFNIYDVRFGLFSRALLNSEKKLQNLDGQEVLLKDWEEQLLNSNQEKNILQEHADGRTEALEKSSASMKRIGKLLKGVQQFNIKSQPRTSEDVGTGQ